MYSYLADEVEILTQIYPSSNHWLRTVAWLLTRLLSVPQSIGGSVGQSVCQYLIFKENAKKKNVKTKKGKKDHNSKSIDPSELENSALSLL